MSEVMYSTRVTASGGRNGHVVIDDGALDVAFAVPKILGGDGEGYNPEQLFAASFAACFMGAVRFVAAKDRDFTVASDASVTATVDLTSRRDGGLGLQIALAVHLPGIEAAKAEEVFRRAHAICAYSYVVRNNLDIVTTLV